MATLRNFIVVLIMKKNDGDLCDQRLDAMISIVSETGESLDAIVECIGRADQTLFDRVAGNPSLLPMYMKSKVMEMNAQNFVKVVGRSNMAAALGVSPSAISMAVKRGFLTPDWLKVCEHLAQKFSIECPREMFSFRELATDSQSGVSGEQINPENTQQTVSHIETGQS